MTQNGAGDNLDEDYWNVGANESFRKYGNCMYYDVPAERATTAYTESKALGTEVDCVNWCETKKQKCVTMRWEGDESKCYISDQKETL